MAWQVVLNCESHYFELKVWQLRAVELRRSSALAVRDTRDAIRDSRILLVEMDDLLMAVASRRASITKFR